MPKELLHALADAEMPLEVVDPVVRDKLRILHDGGHIVCSFPPHRDDPNCLRPHGHCAGSQGPQTLWAESVVEQER